ncbi:hypothetical protein OJAV_G00144290 [Oryzias javanicus]|uniref:Uncharacterized protein n=1 Tax=Oryzias javanicus TaxID=123683 RepID=A0A437CN83_ORYJA|nr:hypothetical protein OJAV_G00144290 [Oryzias javanicus]
MEWSAQPPLAEIPDNAARSRSALNGGSVQPVTARPAPQTPRSAPPRRRSQTPRQPTALLLRYHTVIQE